MQCGCIVDFCYKSKMASRGRREEVLQETFADGDSDLNKKSKLESEWNA